MTAPDEQVNGRVTLRDLVRMEATQERILAEIEKLENRLDTKFDAHAIKHEAEKETHQTEHKADRKERRGLTLWAVTTVMSGLAILIGAVVAVWVASQ